MADFVSDGASGGGTSSGDDIQYDSNDGSVADPAIGAGDVVLPHAMPQAEYMYGCAPTSVAMLLG